MDAIINFLDLNQFVPADILVVLVLVILEGLLSCDNAVVLALLVKDLPPEQRGKALRYGIIGAYVFRIVALLLAMWILTVWWVKVAGGLYLTWLAVDFFRRHGGEGHDHARQVKRIWGLGAFWSTVVWVEMTDVVFSVDSIAAAVAMSKKLWVLILGGLLGILAMRFAAQGFVRLLQRFPRLEACAFLAVGVIGLKLLLEFPVDVAGRVQPLPADATYATAQEYDALVERHCPPAAGVRHVFTVNTAAAPAPRADLLAAGAQAAAAREVPHLAGAEREAWIARRSRDELADAEASWALHHRPFIEVEGWASSLVVMGIFAAGFIRRRRQGP